MRFYGALRMHIKEGLHERRERMATCNFTLSADGLWRFSFSFFSFLEVRKDTGKHSTTDNLIFFSPGDFNESCLFVFLQFSFI